MTTDAALLRSDVKAREAALDTERSFIVQAPAGSGKTELLIQRYLLLLAKVDDPEEILAITFTRKGAAEMRLRVMQALQKASKELVPEKPHQRITFDAAADVLARNTELEWMLIENPGRLRIQTLDSLYASLARMQPLTASGSAGNVIEDSEIREVYSLAAAATLDWLVDDSGNARATAEVLAHVDNNTGAYVGYLKAMLQTRDQWLPIVGSGVLSEQDAVHLRAEFEANLEHMVRGQLRVLQECVPMQAAAEFMALAMYAIENLIADDKADDPICDLGNVPVLPNDTPDDLPRWQALAELLLTRSGAVRKQVNKNQGFPVGDQGQKKAMKAVLEEIVADTEFAATLHAVRNLPPSRYTDEQWSVLLALFRLLPVAVSELHRLCLARGITDHIEIALSAARVLGTADEPGEAALLLDYQVRHILVDEMQDTSKAQYRTLEALTGGWTRGDGRTLFCVGDPMQSIYGFRNAEVAQFLLARETGIGSVLLEPLVLRRNFRSGEYLVDWFNRVFPAVLPDHDDAASAAVAYADAVSVEDLAGCGEVSVHPLFGGSEQAEAAEGRAVIAATLNAHPDDTIAVLVRSRTRLPALLHELREAGIRYQAIDIDRLTDLPEIIDILALTRAFVHTGDRVAWLGLLRSPWIGLDWTDLHTIVCNDIHSTVLELLRDKDRIQALSDYGRQAVRRFLSVLEPYLLPDRSTPLHLRVEKAWFELGGPALMANENAVENVYRYLQILQNVQVAGTIPDTVRFMQQLEDEWVSTDIAAQVQIMTMHKAKGLEFDHVVLYGMGRYNAGNRAPVLSWFDIPETHGREQKVISPVGRRDDIERDPIHRYIEQVKAAKDRHERGRLLYVACTRARKSLHLVGHVRIREDAESFSAPHAASLLRLLWPALENDFANAFESVARASEIEEQQRIAPRLRRFSESWCVPAPNKPPWADPDTSVSADERKVEYYWVGADARLAGTVVHRWLQFAAQQRIDLSASKLSSLRPISARWLKELGAGDSSLDHVCKRVEQALAAVLDDESGRWLLDGDGDAELALSGVYNGRLESVVIDRVRVDDDGTHWIVDYKTSSHEGGDLEGFLQNETARYREQLDKYAAIYRAYSGARVKCALYFPLLKAFVEIRPDL